jgi:tRNA G18 (ribose-2'-O)-methylase SpoU
MRVAPGVVTDPADPRVADFVGLRDARDSPGVIVEGILAVEQLLTSPYPVRRLLVLRSQWPQVEARLGGDGAPVLVADRDVLNATVGFDLHRGVVASADRAVGPTVTDLAHGAHRLALLERVNDHENLGGLFRNGRAFGLDGVVLDPETADPLYRRSVRVSLGHVLHVPFARAAVWADGLDTVRRAGFTLIALMPAGEETIDELAADRPERIAFVLGAEGPGLSDATVAASDRRVRIPMASEVDSLNVATAAAVALSRVF